MKPFCPEIQVFLMFLSVKEMELRKVRFDETFQPGQIDFSGEELVQGSPLHATGSAEVLAHTDGEVRIQGRLAVEMTAQCDRCLGRAKFPLDAAFDLFYRPMSFIARDEEVEIDEGEAEIGFYEGGGHGTGGYPPGASAARVAHAEGLQRRLQGDLPRLRQEPE